MNIQIINNKIHINWYRKPICSGRYFNYFSNHSLSHKICIIYSLTDRAILLSNKRFHIDNLNCVRSTLLKNGYPLQLLNENIFQRYREIIFNQQEAFSMNKIYDIDNQENRKIIIFPYIQNFQEQLCRIFKTYNLQIILTIENTLQKKNFQHLKIKLRQNSNTILFMKLTASNVIRNILDKHVVFYITDCLSTIDLLKIKKTKLHLQNMLLQINILPF